MTGRDRVDDLAAALEAGDDERVAALRGLLGDDAVWAEPPADLEDRVVAAVETDEAGESDVAEDAGEDGDGGAVGAGRDARVVAPARWQRWRPVAAGLVGTAAVAVVVAVLALPAPVATVELAGTDLAPEAQAVATVEAHDGGWQVELDVGGLAPAPEGAYYEGWQRNGRRAVSLGTFHLRGGDDVIPLWSGVPVGEHPVVFVTLEAVDGDAGPSGDVVLEGRATPEP